MKLRSFSGFFLKLFSILPSFICAQLFAANVSVEKLQDSAPINSEQHRKIEWLDSVNRILMQIHSFEYTIERNQPADVVYEKILWREHAANYSFDLFFKEPGSTAQIQRTISFVDGKTHTFFHSSRQLNIKNGEESISDAHALPTPLISFAFASTQSQYLTMKTLKEIVTTDDFKTRLSFHGNKSIAGKNCLVFRVTSSFDHELRANFVSEFYVPLEDYPFPDSWKFFDQKGMLVKEFKLLEPEYILTKKSESVHWTFPRKYSLLQTKFRGTITGPNGKIIEYFPIKHENSFSRIQINHLDDLDLMIDPSMAEYIHDIDTGKNIRIQAQ